MAEDARHEGRDADIGRGAGRDRAKVARERDFRDVELLVAKRAKEDLLRIERQVGDGAALDLDDPVLDRLRAVVVSARDGYWHLDHSVLATFAARVRTGRALKQKPAPPSACRCRCSTILFASACPGEVATGSPTRTCANVLSTEQGEQP